jgi:hypothetical protein
MDDFFTKPVRREDLTTALKELLPAPTPTGTHPPQQA